MKKLEKEGLKKIVGGLRGGCGDRGDGTTRCWITYDNGYSCQGEYDYKGNTISINCGFANS